MSDSQPPGVIAFQGEAGAYSHLACREAYPEMTALPCPTFEDTFAAVEQGDAVSAMIPIENSVAGRVADIHHLMPESGLYIIAEHFQRVNHYLLALPGSKIDELKTVRSHVQALGQCRGFLRRHGLKAETFADTAGAARAVGEGKDKSVAAIASSLAGEIYGLEPLAAEIEDEDHNTTRFLVLAAQKRIPDPDSGPVVTSFIFEVRNVPAALYKALGGFATNGVNMVKLESYQLEGTFAATQFYADILGHPAERSVQLAMEELAFFTNMIKMLGTYPQHPFRRQAMANLLGTG